MLVSINKLNAVFMSLYLLFLGRIICNDNILKLIVLLISYIKKYLARNDI